MVALTLQLNQYPGIKILITTDFYSNFENKLFVKDYYNHILLLNATKHKISLTCKQRRSTSPMFVRHCINVIQMCLLG